ncbi:MAG: PPC domain-containing protein, partial [Pirellulales bacterium]|nr:PPC domain-containing protein [Pirellulales bacterium]
PPPEEPAPEPPAAPNEPNDSLSSATSVALSEGEGQFSGFIGDGDNQSADVDLYSLSLGAGDTLTVDIDARSLSSRSNLDSYLRLFDGDGRQLARNDDANGSLDSFLTYGVQADGTYFIGISAYGNSSYDPTVPGTGRNASSFGHFEARVTVVSNPVEPPPEEPAPPPPIEAPVEPNDSLATAAYVNLEGESFTVSARIGDGAYRRRDVDIYQVDLAAGDTIVVDVDARSLSSPSRLDSFLRLFDSDGRQLARNDDANGSLDSFLSYDVQTEGTYFVGVSSYGNSRYRPTREGSGRRGHTTGRYEATFSRIALSDGDGDDGGILDAGDTLQTALQVDANSGPVRYSGQIGDGAQRTRDVDMYAVNLVAGQQVTVDIDARELAGGSTLDSMLKLFDADGRRLAMNDDTRSSLDSRLVFTAEVAGTYYVGVSGYGNRRYDPNLAGSGRAGSIGNYEVSFEFENASRINRIFGFRDIERGALVAAFAHYDAVADWLDSERR